MVYKSQNRRRFLFLVPASICFLFLILVTVVTCRAKLDTSINAISVSGSCHGAPTIPVLSSSVRCGDSQGLQFRNESNVNFIAAAYPGPNLDAIFASLKRVSICLIIANNSAIPVTIDSSSIQYTSNSAGVSVKAGVIFITIQPAVLYPGLNLANVLQENELSCLAGWPYIRILQPDPAAVHFTPPFPEPDSKDLQVGLIRKQHVDFPIMPGESAWIEVIYTLADASMSGQLEAKTVQDGTVCKYIVTFSDSK
jgi:hypothetical protein